MFKKATLPLALGMLITSVPAIAKDYLAAAAHPDQIVIVDTEDVAIEKILKVENSGTTPIVPVVSPDAKYVYVLANGSESVVKIDMDTGENIGRIDMSSAQERVKALWGVALSPDGKTLAVYQSPVKMLLNEFKVQPTRIAYYDAASLELIHTAPAPRQIVTLAYSTDGSKLYAFGRDLYVFDPNSGAKIDEIALQNWDRETHYPPDLLNVWHQYDTSNMIVTPYYTMRKDKSPDDPEAYVTGMSTFNLATGELTMDDIEPTSTLYFSATASPDHKRAYSVYNVLQSFDLENGGKPLKQAPLPHTFYSAIVSSDNKTLWIGGGAGECLAFDTKTLEQIGQVKIPNGGNMSNNSVRLFTKDD